LEAIALAVVETPKPPVLPKKAVLYEGEADAERAELQRRLDDTEQKLVLAQQTIQQLEEKGKQNNGKEVKEGDSKLQIKTLQSQRDEAQRQAQDVQQKLTKLQEKVSLYERRIPVLETAFESVESLQEKIRILEEEKRELGDKLKAAKEEIKGIKSKPKNTGNSKKR
jgi:chromosome segregation ATPase